MATDRLHKIEAERNTYVALFEDVMAREGFPTTGSEVNYSNVHEQIVVKYIQSLCRNMEKKFGDTVGQVSVAATIFNPASSKLPVEDPVDKIRLLAEHFNLNKNKQQTNGCASNDTWIITRTRPPLTFSKTF